MKKLALFIVLMATLSSCNSQSDILIKKIDVVAFKKGIEKKDIQLIDVRTPEEYEQGHIKNAALLNFRDSNFKEQLQKLDKAKPVYLYCRSGGRSGKASKILEELGFTKIYDLKGGYLAWSAKK